MRAWAGCELAGPEAKGLPATSPRFVYRGKDVYLQGFVSVANIYALSMRCVLAKGFSR